MNDQARCTVDAHRGFTQDDSHLYVAPEQLADEIAPFLDFVLSVLRGVRVRRLHFSFIHQRFRQICGSDEIWSEAIDALQALDRHGMDYAVKEGDAVLWPED